jgi:penicillin-binding protein 2
MQATPLQLAYATSILASRGNRYNPHILLGQQTPGDTIIYTQPIAKETIQLANEQDWDTIINAMQSSVTKREGTSYRFGIATRTYTLAAKTGTAQVFSKKENSVEDVKQEDMPEKLRNHSLLIAFAPIDKPKIVLAIVVENSHVALEVGRQILDYYLGKKSYDNATNTQANAQKIAT